jgi:hypothetical protein
MEKYCATMNHGNKEKMLILNFLDDFFFKKKLKDYVEDSLFTLSFGLRPKA